MNILIAGCSRGIGRGFLETYLNSAEVKKMWAVSTNPDKMKDLQARVGPKLVVLNVSVSDPGSAQAIKTALGGETLDLLINCAGMYLKEGNFAEVRAAALEETFHVNVISAFTTTQACLPSLQKSKNPKVISISSQMGSIDDNTSGGSYAYRISKAAMNMFNKSFSVDFPKITAVVLHPGWVQTEMGGKGAPTTVDESVSGMVKIIRDLKSSQTGHFYDHEGDTIAW